MFLPQLNDFLLRFGGHHTLAMQFTVGTRVRLITRGQQVSGDVAFAGNISDDFNGLVYFWQFGKELGLCVAF